MDNTTYAPEECLQLFAQAKKARDQVDGMILDALAIYENKPSKKTGLKSNITLKEVAKKIEQTIPEIANAFFTSPNMLRVKTRISAEEDISASRYLNREFLSMQSIVDLITDIEKTKMKEGTVWVTSGWETKKFRKTIKEAIYNTPEEIVEDNITDPTFMTKLPDGKIYTKWEEEVYLKNRPIMKKISNEDAYPDPDAKVLEDMRFFAVRKQRQMSRIIKMLGLEGDEADLFISTMGTNTALAQDRKDSLQKYGRAIDNTDEPILRRNVSIIQMWIDLWNEDKQQYEPKIVEWIESNNILLRIIDNPLETGNIPFYNAVYSKVPDSLWGEPLAFFLEDMQKVKTGSFRAILDNTTEANNPKEVIDINAISATEALRYKRGSRFVMAKSPNAIMRLPATPLPPMLLNLIQFADAELVELSGISTKVPALTKSQGDSTRMSEAMLLTQARTELSLRFTGRMISGVARDWLVLANDLLTEQQKQELFQEEYKPYARPFDESMLKHIEVKVATVHAQQNMIFQTNMLLQQSATLQGALPPNSLPKLVAQIYETFGDEETAAEIRMYKPQISPQEQHQMQMEELKQQLALSNMRLKELELEAKVTDLKVKTQLSIQESDSKSKLQTAIAERELATAQKLKTETAFTPAEKLAAIQKPLDEIVPE